ncbi:phasin family protein [Dokdonella immobilis]|uniref:Poly(Hydroxyalkanoate) granule-associated protein n=1 Tax=Dokdonella immobilis TaxID=578942 RepID=A0A1I4VYI3_9GAMM|nr:phasin family protein [Dokdonella immobilis]SFN06292.1 poly(hydroxyalkanoate) granule-associated protein [Dokdonella immobilis]
MSKQIKVTKQAKPAAKVNVDNARKVWLAGLGAFSIVQKQGAELFENMVNEGKSFQTRSEKLARKVSGEIQTVVSKRMKPVEARLQAVRREAEARVEQGVGRVLSYAGIPSKADVDALISRVDALSRQLRAAR